METEGLNIIQQLLGNTWISYITLAVTIAAAITAVTPSKVDNTWLQKIIDLLNLVGFNLGKAKNADAV